MVRWALVTLLLAAACAPVRPWERGRLATPAMQFEFDAYAAAQESSIVEITEGGTFAGSGPGGAGAGCGCH
jgi:hypothetical protein